MKKITILFLLFSLVTISQTTSQSFLNTSLFEGCGTIANQAQLDYMTQSRNERNNWNGPEMTVNLPVQHHVIRQSDGSGGLDANDISSMMNIMNTYYLNANISFYNCGSINFIDNSNYYNWCYYLLSISK